MRVFWGFSRSSLRIQSVQRHLPDTSIVSATKTSLCKVSVVRSINIQEDTLESKMFNLDIFLITPPKIMNIYMKTTRRYSIQISFCHHSREV